MSLRRVPDGLPVPYIILRSSKEVALQRAIERTGDMDLVNSEPVTYMHRVSMERGGWSPIQPRAAHEGG
jgi:hypothetical protein